MWEYMIHNRGGRKLTFRLTVNAKRMPPEICSPRLAPLSVIAPKGSTAAQPVIALGDVFLAVDLPRFAKPGAAWIATGTSRFHGHHNHLR